MSHPSGYLLPTGAAHAALGCVTDSSGHVSCRKGIPPPQPSSAPAPVTE